MSPWSVVATAAIVDDQQHPCSGFTSAGEVRASVNVNMVPPNVKPGHYLKELITEHTNTDVCLENTN